MNTFEEHSPENPTNWIDRLEVFESDDLSQCLDYAKETQDFEPLENAIFLHETKVKKAMEKIVFSLDAMAHSENTFIINQLLAIKRELI
jgi:hypothetical protein